MTALQTVSINNQDVQIKEYQSQRVVTFKEIDRVHGRPEGTARRNFNVNKKHFKENVDYFVAKRDECAMYEFRTLEIPPHGITLITQSGYLMLVKSFGDKLAWSIQRELVNGYFEAKTWENKQLTLLPKEEPRQTVWNGVPVMLIEDLAKTTGAKTDMLHYRIRKGDFKCGIDYFKLQGLDLLHFKEENGMARRMCNCLTVVTKLGADKLAKAVGYELELPTEVAPVKSEKKKMSLDELMLLSSSLTTTLKMYQKFGDEIYRSPLRSSAWMMATELTINLYDLGPIMK